MSKTAEIQSKAFIAGMECLPGERAFVAKITSDAVDRDNEVLLPDGMDATDFQKNPVVFYIHDYEQVPVGKVVALRRQDNHWLAKVVMAERPASHVGEWVPDTLFSLIQQGVINGVSVGFKPVQVRNPTAEDRKRFGPDVARVFARWKLLELSIAPLPANQEALIEAVSKAVQLKRMSEEAAKAVLPKGAELVLGDIETQGNTPEQNPEPKPRHTIAVEPVKRVVIQVMDIREVERKAHAEAQRKALVQQVTRAVREEIAKAHGALWV